MDVWRQPIIITLIGYLIIIFAVGWYSNRYNRSLKDYMLAGRTLSGPVAALGAGASDMSGWLLMALPGAVMVHGLNQIWLPLGLTLGAFLNWQFVASRLRTYSERANDALTIPAYLDQHFSHESKLLRMTTAGVVILFFTFYAAAGFVAGSFLMQLLLGISYHTALFITAAIMISYTCLGGFLAVNLIDFFQGTLMLIGLLFLAGFVFHANAGWHETLMRVHQLAPTHLSVFHGMSTIGIISLLAWGLGYFGQPHILVRFMAVKSHHDIPSAQAICMTWMVLALIAAVMIGLTGVLYTQSLHITNPDRVFLKLSQGLFNPWIAGVLMAAVLSAVMSTLAAQLLAASSALAEDLYHHLFRRSGKNKELLIVSRAAVVVIALIAVLLALNPKSSLLALVGYAWAGLGASFGPVILLSLYWRGMTRVGTIIGMLAGAATVIIWHFLDVHYGAEVPIFKLYTMVPGFIFATMCAVIASLLSSERRHY